MAVKNRPMLIAEIAAAVGQKKRESGVGGGGRGEYRKD
jgi:hypothetical protein